MRHQKEMTTCDNCGAQFNTADQYRNWCTPRCKEIMENRRKKKDGIPIQAKSVRLKRGEKISLLMDDDDIQTARVKNAATEGYRNYYWLLPYVKRLNTFFISDIKKTLDKDDIYFNRADIVKAVKYWIAQEVIAKSKFNFVTAGGSPVNKYIYVKDPV